MYNKILFVIVIYKQYYDRTLSYISLLNNLVGAWIFVYDNSPEAQVVSDENVIYIHDSNNSGLSVAYNKAAKYAKDNGFEWMMVLDQDTTFPLDALSSYIKAVEDNPDIKMIAPVHQISGGTYISPVKFHFKSGHNQKNVKTGIVSFNEACPINSGLLINLDAFYKVGGYDDEVVLDFSDIRFVEKFKKVYNHYYVLPNVVCVQNFSVDETDPRKLITRFNIFLKCAKACKREHFFDGFQYFVCTFKRCLKLTFATRSFIFLKSYFSNYLFV